MMADAIRADYRQQLLLPPNLEDWVPPDHPARFIRDFVDSQDLEGEGFRVPECRRGRPPFAADLLLKVLLYGFFEKMRSFRRLEWACLNVLGVVWLTGQHYPDHNTIWRFWDGNRAAGRRLFKRVVRVAHEVGLVGMVLHALDGTKLATRLSVGGAWHREDMEKLLEETVAQIEREMDRAASEEREDPEYRMTEELQNAVRRKELIGAALAELDAAGTDHVHPKDREARVMKCGRVKELAYNAQAVVDSESGLIVGADVTGDQSDNGQFGGMLDEVEETVGETAEETVADTGYWRPEELAGAAKEDRGVLVNAPPQVTGEREEDGAYHKSRFRHDAEKDVFICPEGKELEPTGTKPSRHDKATQLDVYRCRHYKACAVRWECSGAKRGRTIEKGPHYEAVVRQVEKQKVPEAAALLRRRGEIVERVFGTLKAGHGFRRWSVDGLAKVRAKWSLMCTVLNLRKLHGVWVSGGFAWSGGSGASARAGG